MLDLGASHLAIFERVPRLTLGGHSCHQSYILAGCSGLIKHLNLQGGQLLPNFRICHSSWSLLGSYRNISKMASASSSRQSVTQSTSIAHTWFALIIHVTRRNIFQTQCGPFRRGDCIDIGQSYERYVLYICMRNNTPNIALQYSRYFRNPRPLHSNGRNLWVARAHVSMA